MKRKIKNLVVFILLVCSICACGKGVSAEEEIVGKWIYNTPYATWNFVFSEDGTCVYSSNKFEPIETTYTINGENIVLSDSPDWKFYYQMEDDVFCLYSKSEESEDWKFTKDVSYNPSEPEDTSNPLAPDTLILTSEMIEEIEKDVEESGLNYMLYAFNQMYEDLEFTDIEITNQKKTDDYTYTVYAVLYAKDNFGEKLYQKISIGYFAKEDSSADKGYKIEYNLNFE